MPSVGIALFLYECRRCQAGCSASSRNEWVQMMAFADVSTVRSVVSLVSKKGGKILMAGRFPLECF